MSSKNEVSGEVTAQRETLPHQIKQGLLRYISEAGFKPGDRLPTEPALCAHFGASRTAVREAMKYLELLGIVSIEPGRGTFLQTFDVGKFLSNLPTELLFRREDILEVIRVRQLLEEFCLEQAIVNTDAEEVKHLRELVQAMEERANRGEPMEEEDMAFHRQLAKMANARLLMMILEIFWGLRRRWPSVNDSETGRTRYLRHLRICEAIGRRDLQLARLYLSEHFSGSYEELLDHVEAGETEK